MATATKNGTTVVYKYNDSGIRTSKTVNGVEHIYTLNGSQIVSETWGNNTLIYLYDEAGSPIGMQYRTSSMAEGVFVNFFFEKNLFGDIVAVYNESGVKVISYTYDAWGNHSVTWHNSAGNNTYAQYNPFRYRGYYYDTEIGLYYLQSRYYDPEMGRFLNADGYINANGDLMGYNMYAYCSNNPVMGYDPTGYADVNFKDDEDGNPSNDLGPVNKGHGGTGYKGGNGRSSSGNTTVKYKSSRVTSGTKFSAKKSASSTRYRVTEVYSKTYTTPKTGQIHHVLSKKICQAKQSNPNLDIFGREDSQFKIQALTPEAHRGYQDWHRLYDESISHWLTDHPQATSKEFINMLNKYYEGLRDLFGNIHFHD